jgi:hypothetical protein
MREGRARQLRRSACCFTPQALATAKATAAEIAQGCAGAATPATPVEGWAQTPRSVRCRCGCCRCRERSLRGRHSLPLPSPPGQCGRHRHSAHVGASAQPAVACGGKRSPLLTPVLAVTVPGPHLLAGGAAMGRLGGDGHSGSSSGSAPPQAPRGCTGQAPPPTCVMARSVPCAQCVPAHRPGLLLSLLGLGSLPGACSLQAQCER